MDLETTVFWFRRDLRLDDNRSLNYALSLGCPVQCIFIFDDNILSKLAIDDPRVQFIYQNLEKIDSDLRLKGSSLMILKGDPLQEFEKLEERILIKNIIFSKDYEPYARERDQKIYDWTKLKNITFKGIKDQVIFEKSEIVKQDGKPYTIFTPFKNKWLEAFKSVDWKPVDLSKAGTFTRFSYVFPSLKEIGFISSNIKVKDFSLEDVENYAEHRNFPSSDATSYLSPHVRFGTISIRRILNATLSKSDVFISELVWREFFMQILYHFPYVKDQSFSPKYRQINWRNDEKEFELWKNGKTGYPMVDAGMRQLNETGYMHNRVRMVVASFLCKHLLIDWRWGEAYFAEKLLDYDLSANNGNWQWAAGTGCDAAPYFRVFNPSEQVKKFDPELKYIKRWVKDLNSIKYPQPMVEHSMARNRAIDVYKSSIIK